MKKLAILALYLTMALTFVSCGDSENSPGLTSDRIEREDISKADEIAETFAETWCGNTDGETHCQLTYPDEYIRKLKKRAPDLSSDEYGVEINNEYEYLAAMYNSNLRTHKTNGLPGHTVSYVTKNDNLTKKERRQAEAFFEKNFDVSFNVEKGYRYEMGYENSDDTSNTIRLIKFWVLNSGDEWKVIEESQIEALSESLTQNN